MKLSFRFACRAIWRVGLLLLLTTNSLVAASPPKLDYLFPAGAARGQTVVVTASGTFDHWPVSSWVDRAGLSVDAVADKGKLQFAVAADASPGTYWVRLYDRDGATSLRPFIVGVLPEIVEQEPNDRLTQTQRIQASATINGRLEKNGDVDAFSIALRKGQTLVASIEAHSKLASPMDGVLQICSEDGFVLQQNDDFHGLDPQIAFTAPHEGVYVVRTFAFPAQPDSSIRFSGDGTYVYRLTMTTRGFVDHSMPLSLERARTTSLQLHGWNIDPADECLALPFPYQSATVVVFNTSLSGTLKLPVYDHPSIVATSNNSIQSPLPVDIPLTVTGRIRRPNEPNCFCFRAEERQVLRFRVDSRSLGYPLDPYVRLIDNSGKVLLEVDDNAKSADVEFTHAFEKDGQYRLSVGDRFGHGGFRYVYRATIVEAEPDFSLRLAADSYMLTTGKPLEIPVTVSRVDGFTAAIAITAVDLPGGVCVAPAISRGTGDSAKSVQLQLTSDGPEAAGPIRVVGTALLDEPNERTASYSLPTQGGSKSDVWLTVLANTSKEPKDSNQEKKEGDTQSPAPKRDQRQRDHDWKAGVAEVNITPSSAMWMAGYGSRNRPADGTLDELRAKALALEDGSGNIGVLITLDLVGIDRRLAASICASLSQKHSLDRHQIALCTSHTHSGPVVGKNLAPLHYLQIAPPQQRLVEEYARSLESKVVDLVGRALTHRAPCRLAWGSGTASFAVNRRNNQEKRVPELRAAGSLKGPHDHDVPVLSVRGANGTLVSVVFGYACHATVLDSYQWSSDYPGMAQAELERKHPGCVAMFWAGCGADQNPLPRRDVTLAREYGRRLAAAVDRVLETEMSEIVGPLFTSYREVDIRFDTLPARDTIEQDVTSKNRFVSARAKMLLAEIEAGRPLRPTYPYPIAIWHIGPEVQLVMLGGEVVVDYALRLKSELGGKRTWVAGYTNDAMAYIPSRRVLREGGYEGAGAMVYYGLPTRWAPDVEQRIVTGVHDQLRSTPARR